MPKIFISIIFQKYGTAGHMFDFVEQTDLVCTLGDSEFFRLQGIKVL